MNSLPGCTGVCDDKMGEQSTAQQSAILMAGDIGSALMSVLLAQMVKSKVGKKNYAQKERVKMGLASPQDIRIVEVEKVALKHP